MANSEARNSSDQTIQEESVDPLKKAYGSLKGWKIDSQRIKDELRREWSE